MPTSACSQRRRVVDAVAGHGNGATACLQFANDVRLVGGQHVGADLVDAETVGDGARGAFVVAGHHDDVQPFGM